MHKELEQLKSYINVIERAYTDAKAELIELKIENEQHKIEMLSVHSYSKCPCKDKLTKIRQIVRSIFKHPGAYAVTDGTRGEKVNAVLEICDELIKNQNQIGITVETNKEFLRRAESYSILDTCNSGVFAFLEVSSGSH